MSDLQLLSIAEAAKGFSVSHYTLRAHIKRGAVKTVRLGRRVLISRAEVERITRDGIPYVPRNSASK